MSGFSWRRRYGNHCSPPVKALLHLTFGLVVFPGGVKKKGWVQLEHGACLSVQRPAARFGEDAEHPPIASWKLLFPYLSQYAVEDS